MSDNVDEAKRIIEEMRAKRAALGDTTPTKVKLHYRRLTKPKLASFVWFFYTFIAGMLLSAVLLGAKVFVLFAGIIVLMVITYLRE